MQRLRLIADASSRINHVLGIGGDTMSGEQSPKRLKLESDQVRFLHRLLARLGVRDVDMHDIAQDVMLNAHRYADSFRGKAAVNTWLFRICVREVRRYRTQARDRRWVPMDQAHDAATSDSPLEQLLTKERVGVMQARMRALPNDQREALVMHELLGLSVREIATQLRCPEQTVYSRLRLARRALQAR